jgi:hypothetical protein
MIATSARRIPCRKKKPQPDRERGSPQTAALRIGPSLDLFDVALADVVSVLSIQTSCQLTEGTDNDVLTAGWLKFPK